MEKYYLKCDWQNDFEEVSKDKWIEAERAAGFRPKLSIDDPNYMRVYATAGFSGNGLNGKIKFIRD